MRLSTARRSYDTSSAEDLRLLIKNIGNLKTRARQATLDDLARQVRTNKKITAVDIRLYEYITGRSVEIIHLPGINNLTSPSRKWKIQYVDGHFIYLPYCSQNLLSQYLVNLLLYSPPDRLKISHRKIALKLLEEISPERFREVNKELIWVPDSATAISYRDEGRGAGPFFDHYTIQRATNRRTVIASPSGQNPEDLRTYIRLTPHFLEYGEEDEQALGRKAPVSDSLNSDDTGLLVLPGRARATESGRPAVYAARRADELELIRRARLTGQPLLAICAGSWLLWESFGGRTKLVRDHVYSRMPGILSGGSVGFNKQIHVVKFEGVGHLKGLVWKRDRRNQYMLTVNSIHWMAPDDSRIPDELQISAKARRDVSLAPRGRQGEMHVEEDSVEAFESKHGAPFLGIQWHPEAYNQSDPDRDAARRHHQIIQGMVKAGDVFKAKKRVLRELNTKFSYARTLKSEGIFRDRLQREIVLDINTRHFKPK